MNVVHECEGNAYMVSSTTINYPESLITSQDRGNEFVPSNSYMGGNKFVCSSSEASNKFRYTLCIVRKFRSVIFVVLHHEHHQIELIL